MTGIVLPDVEFDIRQVESCPVVPGYLLKPTKSAIFIDFSKKTISGFAIDRSKKYIKTIKNHMKIDAVNPQAAADNHPPPPVTMVRCPDPYNPTKPSKTPSNSAVT